MFNVIIKDKDNEPQFRPGDVLNISLKADITGGGFYIVKDKRQSKSMLREIKHVGDMVIMRTSNRKIEEPFDPKRHNILAKVNKHLRVLL
jgi:hypothetical protein